VNADADYTASWPALPVRDWQATRDTLHLWTQVVGKIRLALAPPENHWWHVPLYVNAVGLTTSLMPYRGIGVEMVFDFTAHELAIRTTTGQARRVALRPRSVRDFHADVLRQLESLGIDVVINPMPVELPDVVAFTEDTEHASYDADAVRAFWASLVSAHRVLSRFRGEYRGKSSPVHFFWGAFDLATTRFSGRPAPAHPGGIPNCPDHVMVEAYSEEVSSCGYWPGGASEGIFYAYAYPEPNGFRTEPIQPAGGAYDGSLQEFVLPYADVRTARNPDKTLLAFLRSTHDAAARLAQWPVGR
jgi:hypothetical protein